MVRLSFIRNERAHSSNEPSIQPSQVLLHLLSSSLSLCKHRMATFVSLVTCHNCNKMSRHSATNRDHMLGFSKNYCVPHSASKHWTAGRTIHPGNRGRSPLPKFAVGPNSHSALPRSSSTESSTSSSSSTGSMKKFALGHLRKFLLFGSEQRRGRGGLKFFLPAL